MGIQAALDRDEAEGEDFTLYVAMKTALLAERHPVGIAWEAYRVAVDGIIDAAESHPDFDPNRGKVRVSWSPAVQRLHDNTVAATTVALDESLPVQARTFAAIYGISQMHALLLDEMNSPYFKKELADSPKPVSKAALQVRDFFDLKWAKVHLPLDFSTLRQGLIHGRARVEPTHVDIYNTEGSLACEIRLEDLIDYLSVGRAAWIAFHLDVLLVAAQGDLLSSRDPRVLKPVPSKSTST